MGKWLKLLHEEINKKECAFSLVGLVGTNSGEIEKKQCPKIWSVKIRTGDRIDSMTIIDPERLTKEKFERMLIRKFGTERVLEFNERKSN